LLLADPLGKAEAWEEQLAGSDEDGKNLLIKYVLGVVCVELGC
jgi:hypothetical protein